MKDDDGDGDNIVTLGEEIAPGVTPFHQQRGEMCRSGIAQRVREGESLTPDALILEPTGEPNRYRATEVRELLGGHGPAQVATEEYKDGWDRIFGSKQEVGQA